FSMLLPERSYLRVEATEPTTVIRLQLDDLLHLTAKHRDFQLAMFRVAANAVKQLAMVNREIPRPAVVGLFHHSDASRPLANNLVRRLRQLGESPSIAGDEERWRPEPAIPYRLLFENGVFIGSETVKNLLKEWVSHERLLIDLSADHRTDDLTRLITY